MIDRDRILGSIRGHEGVRLTAYRDTVGVLTIGYGHTKDVREGQTCTLPQADAWLESDVDVAHGELVANLPWVEALPQAAYEGLVEAAFQLGVPRLLRFRRMLEAVRNRKWALACVEAYDSRWSKQTPNRVLHLARCFAEADEALR